MRIVHEIHGTPQMTGSARPYALKIGDTPRYTGGLVEGIISWDEETIEFEGDLEEAIAGFTELVEMLNGIKESLQEEARTGKIQ